MKLSVELYVQNMYGKVCTKHKHPEVLQRCPPIPLPANYHKSRGVNASDKLNELANVLLAEAQFHHTSILALKQRIQLSPPYF